MRARREIGEKEGWLYTDAINYNRVIKSRIGFFFSFLLHLLRILLGSNLMQFSSQHIYILIMWIWGKKYYILCSSYGACRKLIILPTWSEIFSSFDVPLVKSLKRNYEAHRKCDDSSCESYPIILQLALIPYRYWQYEMSKIVSTRPIFNKNQPFPSLWPLYLVCLSRVLISKFMGLLLPDAKLYTTEPIRCSWIF